MSYAIPTWRLERLGTTGILDDSSHMANLRDRVLPPTAAPFPVTHVLDLKGVSLTAPVLRELILSLGQRFRGGVYGDARLVIAGIDSDTAEVVGLLAEHHELPLFIATSARPEDVDDATPAERFSPTEEQTIAALKNLGGAATVAGLAGAVGVGVTAMNNRLTNLEKRKYVYRLRRGRQRGDVFVDPRITPTELLLSQDLLPQRTALLEAGIATDIYDRTPIVLSGRPADRVKELLGESEQTPSD